MFDAQQCSVVFISEVQQTFRALPHFANTLSQAQPPLAHERLQETSGRKLVYRMKTPWRSGATQVLMERIELLEKLAALVPRPRYHVVHYYGILAPAVKWRRDIVPDPPPEQCSQGSDIEDTEPPRKNCTWAQLMARTFEFDVLQCPRCGGRMKIIAAIESPEVACLEFAARTSPFGSHRRVLNTAALYA